MTEVKKEPAEKREIDPDPSGMIAEEIRHFLKDLQDLRNEFQERLDSLENKIEEFKKERDLKTLNLKEDEKD